MKKALAAALGLLSLSSLCLAVPYAPQSNSQAPNNNQQSPQYSPTFNRPNTAIPQDHEIFDTRATPGQTATDKLYTLDASIVDALSIFRPDVRYEQYSLNFIMDGHKCVLQGHPGVFLFMNSRTMLILKHDGAICNLYEYFIGDSQKSSARKCSNVKDIFLKYDTPSFRAELQKYDRTGVQKGEVRKFFGEIFGCLAKTPINKQALSQELKMTHPQY